MQELILSIKKIEEGLPIITGCEISNEISSLENIGRKITQFSWLLNKRWFTNNENLFTPTKSFLTSLGLMTAASATDSAIQK